MTKRQGRVIIESEGRKSNDEIGTPKARKAAVAEGRPLTRELAIPGYPGGMIGTVPKFNRINRKYVSGRASKSEQYARYLDCGPNTWDDR